MKYAEYKDSKTPWMGAVPSHWTLERAKWSFALRNERGNDTPILLAATQKHGMYPQDLIEGVVKVAEGTDVQQFRTVHKGDFVISLRSFQGGFERSDYEGVCSPAYQVFYANERWVTSYLKYLFKNELFVDAMNSLTVGIREGRNIKYEDFANSILAIPPISEQEVIAAFLDKKIAHIDSVIDEAKASIEEYKAWKASIIYEAVTKGLDPNVEMKDSGIERLSYIPEKWKVTRFKYLIDIKSGDAIKNELIYEEGANPVYGGGDRIGYTDSYNAISGSILVGRVGARCGFTTLLATNAWATDNALILEPFIESRYLYYLLVAADLNSLNTSNAQPLITGTKIRNCYCAITEDSKERTAIVAYLDNKCFVIERLIDEKYKLIQDLESYKKSLIFEIVTGKRRVC